MDKPKPTGRPGSEPASNVSPSTETNDTHNKGYRSALEATTEALRHRYRSQLAQYGDNAPSDYRKPKWEKWRLMPDVALWEGVALSLNIEPTLVKHSAHSWMVEEHMFDEEAAFRERLEIASRNLGTDKALLPVAGVSNDRVDVLVKLVSFAAWAVKIGWADLPAEFVDIAGWSPADITPDQLQPWLRKDTWTVRETAFLLNGWLPDLSAPRNNEINQTVDDIKRGLRAGGLHAVGEVSKADQLFDGQHLRPQEVIMWALGRFPRFPCAPADLPPSPQTPVSDYLNGRILIEVMRELDREIERRKLANENSVADALTAVRARTNDLLAGAPIAAREVSALLADTPTKDTQNKDVDPPALAARAETTYQNIVGVLLEVIRKGIRDSENGGTIGPAAGFKSDAKLIAAIDALYDGYPGLSRTNLLKKFAEAKRSIGQA